MAGPQITDKDVAAARRVYWMLFLMPLLAVPAFLCGLTFASYDNTGTSNTFGSALFSAGIPLIFYLPVLIWSFSANPFLKAHARQGLILLSLRFLSAFMFAYFGDYALCWGLFNAILWFAGSLIGLSQSGQGKSWLGSLHAVILPDQPSAPPNAPPPATAQSRTQAVASCLETFRTGNPSERRIAAARLESLGEVETF